MSTRREGLLLASWAVFAVVPGVVAQLVFTIDLNSTDLGGAFGIWILGYLIQLGFFMAAARKFTGNNVLGWIVASLLPWATDFAVPATLWAVVPCAAVAVANFWLCYRGVSRHSKLDSEGIEAIGTVLEVIKPKLMNVVINDVYIKRKLRLRVERADGAAAYEAVYDGTFMLGDIPAVGARLSLRVDPHRPDRFDVVDGADDGAIAPSAPSGAGRFVVPSGSTVSMHVGSDDDVADAMQKLTQLHASGALTDDEFAKAKQRVLDE